jgi:pimeloyl-ACP methyl ester carboxylesterase
MFTPKTAFLKVPGADLYYRVNGSGPILLMIHGGNGQSGVFDGVLNYLAERYTVLTYDRRGYFHSKIENPEEGYRVSTHGDDAYRLLTSLTSEPAYVFASSAGAVISIELFLRHPEAIRILVAHEPPLFNILPNPERQKAVDTVNKLHEDYRNIGLFRAVENFVATTGTVLDLDKQFAGLKAEQIENISSFIKYFVERETIGIRDYVPDMDALNAALKNTSARIVPAVGRESKQYNPYDCTIALAEYIQTDVVEFPGDHVGYITHPAAFAERLHEVLHE